MGDSAARMQAGRMILKENIYGDICGTNFLFLGPFCGDINCLVGIYSLVNDKMRGRRKPVPSIDWFGPGD